MFPGRRPAGVLKRHGQPQPGSGDSENPPPQTQASVPLDRGGVERWVALRGLRRPGALCGRGVGALPSARRRRFPVEPFERSCAVHRIRFTAVNPPRATAPENCPCAQFPSSVGCSSVAPADCERGAAALEICLCARFRQGCLRFACRVDVRRERLRAAPGVDVRLGFELRRVSEVAGWMVSKKRLHRKNASAPGFRRPSGTREGSGQTARGGTLHRKNAAPGFAGCLLTENSPLRPVSVVLPGGGRTFRRRQLQGNWTYAVSMESARRHLSIVTTWAKVGGPAHVGRVSAQRTGETGTGAAT